MNYDNYVSEENVRTWVRLQIMYIKKKRLEVAEVKDKWQLRSVKQYILPSIS